MHHLVINLIIAMLGATLILFYHASMLTPKYSSMSYALWLPQNVILQSLECIMKKGKKSWAHLFK
jgi:hypothetical protein